MIVGEHPQLKQGAGTAIPGHEQCSHVHHGHPVVSQKLNWQGSPVFFISFFLFATLTRHPQSTGLSPACRLSFASGIPRCLDDTSLRLLVNF